MEPSELEVLGRSVDEGIERHEADDFALRDLDAFFCRKEANRFVRLDERRLAVIHHVHRHLYEPAVRELESLGPHGRQPSVALSDGLRDALRDADVRGSEVHVPSDEDRSRADDARPRGRMEAAWPEVGRSIRVRLDLGLQALVLATPDIREGPAIQAGRGGLVQVDGDLELIRDPLADGTGEGDAVVHRDSRNGDEREDVERSDPGVFPVMHAHVDQFHGFLRTAERRLCDRGTVADERDHGSIVVRVHLPIEDPHTGHRRNCLGDCIDHLLAVALGEIRNALDNLRHAGPARRRTSGLIKLFLGPSSQDSSAETLSNANLVARTASPFGGVGMTGRVRMFACLLTIAIVGAALFLTFPAAAPLPISMRTQGQAFDRAGAFLPVKTPIRAFVDGVDYSDDSQVQNGAGTYSVLISGNSKNNANVSDTPAVLEGANLGDPVIYAAGDFTTATEVFRETVPWSPGTVQMMDLHVGSSTTTPQPLKIEGLVTQPARGGNQFAYLCNPTAGAVSLSAYYLETDAPGTYHGSSLSLSGVLNPASTIRQDLPLPTWLRPTGDALKLVYRNPGGTNASASGRDIIVDRVEFNASPFGSLTWEPGNTIMGDAPAPGPGRILERVASCTDTNQPSDFTIGIEPGLPANGPPTVAITMPTNGQALPAAGAVTLSWTMSDDVFLTRYLHVWVNVTIGNQTIPILTNGVGNTSVLWTTPAIAASDVVVRVDVEDPFGAQASDTRTISLTRQSPLAIIVAVLIAILLGLFLLFAFLRARKKPKVPAEPPPTPPPGPAILPPVGAAKVTPGLAPDKKVCPRCHTHVNADDVTCFFCGYKFPEEAKPPP